jgi:hypothetical protein
MILCCFISYQDMNIKFTYQAKVWVNLTLTFESTQPRRGAARDCCPAMWTRFEIHEYSNTVYGLLGLT